MSSILGSERQFSTVGLDLPQHAQILLSIFARRHGGLFILDGPRTSPEASRSVLDVYCVFVPLTLQQAQLTAQNALSSLGRLQVNIRPGSDLDGAALNQICRRARVFGERRRLSR
jgi:hypothetical protein